jgi:glycosyltransferase involved in cell wall biosynthesis
MPKPLIVYDVSVFGTAYYYKRARTGIFRVAENIASGLVHSPEYELFFSACASVTHRIQSAKYLESSSGFRGFRAQLIPDNCLFTNLLSQLYPDPEITTLSQRVQGKFVSMLSRVFWGSKSINSSLLKKADIFHTPYHPIPERAKKSRDLKRFITIYDMIPILYPQYFQFNEPDYMQKILNSIGSHDWVFAISESTKNDLCTHLKIDPTHVIVNPLAASHLFYQCEDSSKLEKIRQKYSIPEKPYILSVSTLEPRKNIDHVIRCFAKLVQQEKLHDLNLVLVGSQGWNYDQIFAAISEFKELKDRIIVTGFVDDEDLATIYSNALMFLYPSFYEGFGLPPLEAMQCGLPVITSDTSSLPEVVGDAGMMVNPADEDALCQGILDIYINSALQQQMSKRSLIRSQLFSWKKFQQNTITGYQEALLS